MTIHPPASVAVDGRAPHTLEEWAEQLERTLFPLGWEQPPIVAGMLDGAVDLCLPPERHDDPVGDLVGFHAPEHWWAMGVITSGRVHDLHEEGGRAWGVRTDRPRRARTGHLVDRHGNAVSFLRLDDDPPTFEEEPSVGRVDDVCRRALDLPTRPPEVPIDVLWATRWLVRVLAAGAASPSNVATWSRVAGLHQTAGCGAASDSVEGLVAAGRTLAAAGSWEALRGATAAGRRHLSDLTPSAADWMDEGIFSRWLLQDLPPLSALRAALAEVVPSEIAAAVDEVLDGWGLP